jgi:hypothetical protein
VGQGEIVLASYTVHLWFCVDVLFNANYMSKLNAASLDVEMARTIEILLMCHLNIHCTCFTLKTTSTFSVSAPLAEAKQEMT